MSFCFWCLVIMASPLPFCNNRPKNHRGGCSPAVRWKGWWTYWSNWIISPGPSLKPPPSNVPTNTNRCNQNESTSTFQQSPPVEFQYTCLPVSIPELRDSARAPWQRSEAGQLQVVVIGCYLTHRFQPTREPNKSMNQTKGPQHKQTHTHKDVDAHAFQFPSFWKNKDVEIKGSNHICQQIQHQCRAWSAMGFFCPSQGSIGHKKKSSKTCNFAGWTCEFLKFISQVTWSTGWFEWTETSSSEDPARTRNGLRKPQSGSLKNCDKFCEWPWENNRIWIS